jgi:hypothetical protein
VTTYGYDSAIILGAGVCASTRAGRYFSLIGSMENNGAAPACSQL